MMQLGTRWNLRNGPDGQRGRIDKRGDRPTESKIEAEGKVGVAPQAETGAPRVSPLWKLPRDSRDICV